MNMFKLLAIATTTFALPASAFAEDLTVQMNAVSSSGIDEPVGAIVISKIAYGVKFTPTLVGLTPGEHGFHVHENASCEPAMDEEGKMAAAQAAGGHYDPEATGKHDSPFSNEGHRGDLPVLVADASGNANTGVEAARLSIDELQNRTLMVHVGGDNYSDHPEPLGGGGARFACGVIHP